MGVEGARGGASEHTPVIVERLERQERALRVCALACVCLKCLGQVWVR